jgi:hypothetical protein
MGLKWWKALHKKREKWVLADVKGDSLLNEIWRAHRDWEVAQQKLDYALDRDQIDYAIYILEAAEQRYDMLIREAKRQRVSLVELHVHPEHEQVKTRIDG